MVTIPAILLLLTVGPVADEQPWTTPAYAARLSQLDCARQTKQDPLAGPCIRYCWIPDGAAEKQAATNYAVNLAISTAREIQILDRVPEGDGRLLRIDFRRLCPEEKDLARVLQLWERLAETEPYFTVRREVEEKTAPYKASDGKTYSHKFVRRNQFALHADVNALLVLQSLTGSAVPVVRYDYLLEKLLTTIEGGLYYDFRQVDPKLEDFMKRLGVDPTNIGQGPADEKSGIFRSRVTGKPRVVVLRYGQNVRPSLGPPLFTITLDAQDGDVKRGQHPIYNLVKFEFRASEAIGVLPNGLPVYALYDAAGNRADEVPPNIATDHTIPAPHTSRLNAALSCIRCHGPDEGRKHFHNDVRRLLTSGSRFGPLADLGLRDKTQQNVLDTVRGMYLGHHEIPLDESRNGHARAAYVAVGGVWREDAIAKVAATLSEIWQGYRLDEVDAAVACREMGIVLTKGTAAEAFAAAVPKLPADENGISLEDPTIASLVEGIPVNRVEWEAIYPDVMLRYQAHLQGTKTP